MPADPQRLTGGVLFALAAGLMWGLVFVVPLVLPDYPPTLLAVGRYLAFGLIALPLAWWDRHALRQLGRRDWWTALELATIGNLLYYVLLASALQRAGGALPTLMIGTLPVVIALTAHWRQPSPGGWPWRQLAPSLGLIALGLGLVNQVELAALLQEPQADLGRYASGALLAVGAVACWTWYPVRNAEWLQRHPDRSPRTWATAQGLATLPLALVGYALLWMLQDGAVPMPWGPRPALFVGLMVTLGLLASWVGTLCWNAASQRLPTALAGQLIVFETLAALTYAFAWRGAWPQPLTLAGIVALIAGVVWAVRLRPDPVVAQAHPD